VPIIDYRGFRRNVYGDNTTKYAQNHWNLSKVFTEERLYDYNHTRPSEHVKRARLLKEMLAECGAGSDYNQRKTGSSVGELPALLIACGFLQGASGWAHPVFVI